MPICPKCQNEYSGNDSTCPICARDDAYDEFDEVYDKNPFGFKQVSISLLIILILVFSGFYLFRILNPPHIYVDQIVAENIAFQMARYVKDDLFIKPATFDQKQISDMILHYLSNPSLRNTDFTEQITNTKVNFEIHDLSERKLYFSHPAVQFDKEEILPLLSTRPENVEYGVIKNGKTKLGNYTLVRPNTVFFRLPYEDFIVNSGKTIKIDFENTFYDITVEELCSYLQRYYQYGGYTKFFSGYKQGKKKFGVNHCPWITRNAEPSLVRLTNRLVRNVTGKEKKAQILLDFVTTQIQYDISEASINVETMKRPNEILLTKRSDSSGKTILYASLLEQIKAEYFLVYYDRHINIAVNGKFTKSNGLFFKFGKKEYFIAEVTYPKFEIGKTSLENHKKIKFVQKPGKHQKIYDIVSGIALPFVEQSQF